MVTKKTKTDKKAEAAPTKRSTSQKKLGKAKNLARKIAAKTTVRLTRVKARANKAVETAKAAKKSTNSRMKVKAHGHAPHSARISEQKGPVRSIASRTKFAPLNSPDRQWLLVDVAGLTVGRVASEIAMLLRGKHKASFTPNNDAGDFVIVVNAEKVKFTSTKEDNKEYFHHSGWIGGLKVTTPARLRKEFPERIIENAVKGMVPRNPLGRDQMRKLKIYAGDKHPHAAQNPVAWKLRYSNNQAE